MRAAWDIAHVVERANAAERVRIRGRRRGQSMNDAVAREYDPLAATCLAMLIESRMIAKPTPTSSVGTAKPCTQTTQGGEG